MKMKKGRRRLCKSLTSGVVGIVFASSVNRSSSIAELRPIGCRSNYETGICVLRLMLRTNLAWFNSEFNLRRTGRVSLARGHHGHMINLHILPVKICRVKHGTLIFYSLNNRHT